MNTDEMLGSIKVFNRVRGRDKNLEIAVSDTGENLIDFVFNA